jgi:hypothetical protein
MPPGIDPLSASGFVFLLKAGKALGVQSMMAFSRVHNISQRL